MRKAVRRAIAAVAPPRFDAGVRVLLYHAIGDPAGADPMGLRVARQAFREQLKVLQGEGYRVVPLTSILDPAGDARARRIAITFDDGYRSELGTAEILGEFGYTATFFVVPRFLDGLLTTADYWEQWPHMNWDEISGLARSGFDVGAHSMTHPDLTGCTALQLAHEIGGARVRLEERLGCRIASFSYPYGRHDARVRDAVERAGYQLACTSRYGLHAPSSEPTQVPRTEVAGSDRSIDFRRKLQGQYDWMGFWKS